LDILRLRLQPDAEPLAHRLPFREQPSGQTLAQDRDAPPTRPIGPGEVASGHDPYADGVEEAGRDWRLLREHAALEHRGFAGRCDQLRERAARAWLQQRGADAADSRQRSDTAKQIRIVRIVVDVVEAAGPSPGIRDEDVVGPLDAGCDGPHGTKTAD